MESRSGAGVVCRPMKQVGSLNLLQDLNHNDKALWTRLRFVFVSSSSWQTPSLMNFLRVVCCVDETYAS